MPTHPTIMKLRLKAINTIISAIPVKPATDYWLDSDEIQINRAESALANRLRQELHNLPKGYNTPNHSLKTQAKARFLQWRENQAKGEWKTLTEAEQAVWEGYVSEGVEFGTIRERELAREAPLKKGDRVVLVNDVHYLGDEWPKGSTGEVGMVVHDHVTDLDMCFIHFDGDLYNLNVHMHEVKKES